MPLTRTEKINEFSTWALWHITEETEELIDFLSPSNEEKRILDAITIPVRQREWLASRILTKQLAAAYNIPYMGIEKDNFGKPWLKGSSAEISISHSYPYAAAIIHLHKSVGIDLEHFKPKLVNIAERFLSAEELLHTEGSIAKLCVCWCAKEVLYKIYHQKKLILKKDLEVLPFNLHMEGFLMGLIHQQEKSIKVKIKYIHNHDHIIAFCV